MKPPTAVNAPAVILREHAAEVWQRIAEKFPEHKEAIESIGREDLRRLEPWPEWVLRIGVELLAVRYPQVDRQVAFQTLKLLHSLVFGLPVEPGQSITGDAFKSNMFHLLGHLDQHTQRKFAEAEAKLGQSPELNALKKEWREGQSKGWSQLIAVLADLDTSPTHMMEKVVAAKRATFDKDGNPRSTPATEAYQAIFDNWTQVEKMSGQAELAKFLAPHLGKSRSSEQKYDLVKKLCRRMEIVFQPNLSRDKPGG